MNPMLNIAIQAIRQAGNFIIQQYDVLNNKYNIKTSKHENNLLLKINKKTNQLISNIIEKYYPLHTITIQNNYNYTKIDKKKTQWIIHPLDSQINFIKHLPYFALSISIKIKGRTEISVIYDPIHNDLFSAIRGQGMQLNGYRIHHYITKTIPNNYVIITHFPYSKQHNNILNKCCKIQEYINIRHSGAIMLDLAYVAVGRIDILLITNIKQFNLENGFLLIKEAGGLIIDFNHDHQKNHQTSEYIVTGNPKFIQYTIQKTRITK